MNFRKPSYVLTISCLDQPGIVAAISGCLAESACNITDSAQYSDPKSGQFFMRVSFAAPGGMTLEHAGDVLKPV